MSAMTSDERLVTDLLAAHEATRLGNSLYLAAAIRLSRKTMPHWCQGSYAKGRIVCRICGRQM